MKPRHIKLLTLSAVLILAALAVWATAYVNGKEKESQVFDAALFSTAEYTQEELMLFADIAFNRKSRRIRKWTTDIRVEIKNIEELDREAIEEVDSIIAILSPLIAPLSMERVNSGGNLHIYRAVDTAPLSSRPRKIVHLNGLAKINSETPLSWDIKYAHIYDGKHVRTQTLMHEFEHALGLEHPFRLYEYYLTIGRSAIPQHYTAYGGWLRFHSMPYYISPQEKAAIRLLYSPAIRPGLHHDTFTRGMDLE